MGFSVLTTKERTTVERDIKQLLRDANDNRWNIHTNRTSQTNASQSTTFSSMESLKDKSSAKKSSFSLFLDSVSPNTTKNHSVPTANDQVNPITDELLLYKSLALKEVKQAEQADLNPNASAFW